MRRFRPFLIILTIGFLSFTGGYSVYFLPQVLGSRASSTASNQQPATNSQQPARARMWLQEVEPQRGSTSASTAFINQGTTLDLELVINANGEVINGVDSIISFDPEILEIKEIKEQPLAQNEQTAVQSVLHFPKKDVREGKIYITAVKETADEIPTNELTLATITLKGLKSGTTTLNFDHFPGKTYGSTIIRASDSENILDQVSSATILIQ